MEEYLKLLRDYVSFKSISTDPEMNAGIKECADWLLELFKDNGFECTLLNSDGLNPVVYASYEISSDAEWVLVYGHYDVQPADLEDGWASEPFKLTERDGRLYARGVMDNKGQNLIHIYTVMKLIKEGRLKYNVKFLIEGNEETGGVEQLRKLMLANRELFKSDHFLVSDGELISGQPAIEASFRGGFNLTLKYTVAKNNVHSGVYGGAVPNSADELSRLLSKIYDENSVVTIPNFYDNVDNITQEQLENNSRLADVGQKESLDHAGFKELRSENGKYDLYTQTGLRPTLQITGLKSGYISNGYSNIVPAIAEVKINFRTVASQKSEDVLSSFKEFVKSNTPSYVDWDIEVDGMHEAVKLDVSKPIFKEVREILKNSHKGDVYTHFVGGAIPIVTTVKELFNIDAVSVGLGNEDCNMHGANENFTIDLIQKGLVFSEGVFSV